MKQGKNSINFVLETAQVITTFGLVMLAVLVAFQVLLRPFSYNPREVEEEILLFENKMEI